MSGLLRDFKFIGLLFPIAEQEQAAVRLLQALAPVLGDQVCHIRPETDLEEIFEWGWGSGIGTAELIAAFEEGTVLNLDRSLSDFPRMTFREFVEFVSRHNQA